MLERLQSFPQLGGAHGLLDLPQPPSARPQRGAELRGLVLGVLLPPALLAIELSHLADRRMEGCQQRLELFQDIFDLPHHHARGGPEGVLLYSEALGGLGRPDCARRVRRVAVHLGIKVQCGPCAALHFQDAFSQSGLLEGARTIGPRGDGTRGHLATIVRNLLERLLGTPELYRNVARLHRAHGLDDLGRPRPHEPPELVLLPRGDGRVLAHCLGDRTNRLALCSGGAKALGVNRHSELAIDRLGAQLREPARALEPRKEELFYGSLKVLQLFFACPRLADVLDVQLEDICNVLGVEDRKVKVFRAEVAHFGAE